MRKEDVKKGSIYELDGVVPLKEALPLGIQHVLAMFLGNVYCRSCYFSSVISSVESGS